MKVRLASLAESSENVFGDRYVPRGAFSPNREYVVLGIETYRDRRPELRLITDDDGSVALLSALAFEITDPTPSARWIVSIGADGAMALQPASWSAPDFWSEFLDEGPVRAGDPSDQPIALAFWRELVAMYREAGEPVPGPIEAQMRHSGFVVEPVKE